MCYQLLLIQMLKILNFNHASCHHQSPQTTNVVKRIQNQQFTDKFKMYSDAMQKKSTVCSTVTAGPRRFENPTCSLQATLINKQFP